MGITEVIGLIGAAASLLCTLVVGALAFFIKRTLLGLENADKKNSERIDKLADQLSDLKADLPLLYVTREDFIRIMNRVEEKLDRLLYGTNTTSKKEE